jgi:hypothetical protein
MANETHQPVTQILEYAGIAGPFQVPSNSPAANALIERGDHADALIPIFGSKWIAYSYLAQAMRLRYPATWRLGRCEACRDRAVETVMKATWCAGLVVAAEMPTLSGRDDYIMFNTYHCVCRSCLSTTIKNFQRRATSHAFPIAFCIVIWIAGVFAVWRFGKELSDLALQILLAVILFAPAAVLIASSKSRSMPAWNHERVWTPPGVTMRDVQEAPQAEVAQERAGC